MDRKDFYRELMETYTVDTEKIKCLAKRKAVKKNGSNAFRWVTCAAACTAAAAAIVIFSNMLPKPGVDITDAGLDTAIERVYAAEQRYKELAEASEVMDMYVSFEEEHSLNEILIAFSSVDNNMEISPLLLYTSEGKYYRYSDKISSGIKFRGAKITAPTRLFEELNRLKIVSLAEPVEGSRYTDKSFVPYVKKEPYETVVTTGENIQISLPEITTFDTTTVPDTQPSEVTTEVTVPETTEKAPARNITIPVSGVKTARFISREKLTVTTLDSIRLYKLCDGELQLETTFYAEDARIAYSNPQGTALFITACDAGGRNRLYYAEGESGSLSEIDVSSITGGNAEIAFISCSGDGTVMLFKTVSPEKICIYYAQRSGGSVSVAFTKEYTNPVSVISYNNGIIYTAVTDSANAVTKIYAVNSADGSEKELASYSEALQFGGNASMDTAAFTVVQDGVSKHLILTPEGDILEVGDSPVFSSVDGRVLKVGEKYFRLEQGALTELEGEEAAAYFAEPEYSYPYRVDISQDGTAELIAP